MKATKFEFEHRFWIISGIFLVGFCCFRWDINALAWLRHLIGSTRLSGAAFSRIALGFGALLVFLAAIFRTWASAYLRTEIVHDTSQHAEALVADGPFRFTRNPLYFANVPMAFGLGLLSSRLGCLFLVAANWLFVYRLIFREEAALRETQGEPYRAYCRVVPRFWPALAPRVPASGRQPSWGQAFAGETFIWLFALAELTIALTLRPLIGIAVFAAGFVAHFVTIPLVKRRADKI